MAKERYVRSLNERIEDAQADVRVLQRKKMLKEQKEGEHAKSVRALEYLEGNMRAAMKSRNEALGQVFELAMEPIEAHLVSVGVLG